MIDIHTHVLRGLDDGAETLEESLELIEQAAAAGTTDLVATPHADPHFSFSPELVHERLAELRAACNPAVNLHYGCDFHLSHTNLAEALADPARFTVNHRNYLLVEFSDLVIFKSSEADLRRLLDAGMVPVITHPERNPLLRQRRSLLEHWVRFGCRLQVTASAYLGRFGRRARAFAEELTDSGLVHFVASDAHDPEHRPARLDEARRWIEKTWSAALARSLFETNPKAVLEGAPVPELPPAMGRRRSLLQRLFR